MGAPAPTPTGLPSSAEPLGSDDVTGPSGRVEDAGPDGSVAVLGELLGLRRATGGDAVTHLALPRASSPRFYAPVTHRGAAAASCLAYNRLRPHPVARRRAVVGWGLRVGVVQRLRGTPMTSGASTGRFADAGGDGSTSLVDHLARRLGTAGLQAATSPRQIDPFWTPTLQLFDPEGRPVGYAKVGWTDLTRAQVDVEADLLARFTERQGHSFVSPAAIDRCTWGDATVSVTAPMPADVARVGDGDGPFPRALLEVAGLDGPPQVAPFGRSGGALWAARLLAGAPGRVPGWAHSLGVDAWAAPRAVFGDRRVLLGRWHGDWVPWNVARSGAELWVWDWEFSGADRPVGLDAYHWYYQQARIVKRAGVVAALDASRRLGARHLDALGVAADTEPVIAAAHALELVARVLNSVRLGAPQAERTLDDLPALCAVLAARAERNAER